MAIRLIVALSRIDSHWPDEHFQSLEPAGKAVFGFGTMSWEWTSGYRAWVVPALYIPLFWLLKLFGLHGGSWTIWIARAYTAVFATGVLVQLDRLLRDLKTSLGARLIALGFIGFSVSMILWSCATLGDTWAMVAVWGVLPAILSLSRSTERRHWIWIGVLVGLPALIKLQLAAWIAGLGLALFLTGAPIRLMFWAVLGGAIDLLALGALDWVTWGFPFHSLLEQVAKGNSISRFYGVAPWWAFFPQVWDDLGAPLFLLMGGLLLGAGCFVGVRRQWRTRLWDDPKGRRICVAVFLPALCFALMLMAIDHKEERFLLPVFPMFYLALGLLIDPLVSGALGCGYGIFEKKRVLVPAFAVAVLVSSYVSVKQSLARPLYLTSVNIGELEGAIYEDGGLSSAGDNCVLLIGHNWSWTHGQLILGARVRLVDDKLDKIAPEEFDHCAYAILPISDEKGFIATVEANRWARLKQASSVSYVLYKRTVRVPSDQGAR